MLQEAHRTAPLHPHCISWAAPDWELPVDFLRSLLQTFTVDSGLWCFTVLPYPSNSWVYLSLSECFIAPAPYLVILPLEFQIVLLSVTCRKQSALQQSVHVAPMFFLPSLVYFNTHRYTYYYYCLIKTIHP